MRVFDFRTRWTLGQLDTWTGGQVDNWTAGHSDSLDSGTLGQLDSGTTGQLTAEQAGSVHQRARPTVPYAIARCRSTDWQSVVRPAVRSAGGNLLRLKVYGKAVGAGAEGQFLGRLGDLLGAGRVNFF